MFMRRAARDLDARCLGWNPRLSSLELVNWTVEAVSFLPLPFCPAANFLLRWSSLPVHHRIPESGAIRAALVLRALRLPFYSLILLSAVRPPLLRSTKMHVILVLRWVWYHQFVWACFMFLWLPTLETDSNSVQFQGSKHALWRITRLSNRS